MYFVRNGCFLSNKLLIKLYCSLPTQLKSVSANLSQSFKFHQVHVRCLTSFSQICSDKVCHIHQPQHQSVRWIFNWPNPYRKNQNFRNIDKVPENFRCVYVSRLNTYLTYIYPICLFTCFASLALTMNHFFLSDPETVLNVRNVQAGYYGTISTTQLIGGTTFSTVMGLLVWRFTKKTPLRIYFNDDDETFVLAFPTSRPWKTTTVKCKPGDLVHKYPSDPDEASLILSFSGEYVLNGRRLVMNPNIFSQPHYYNLLLGIRHKEINKYFD
ncbi:hypothetical protein CHUAL_001246 [Chamberlinius hualienensis]